jgi:hypothetical protein
MGIWYCTREDVKSSGEIKSSAFANPRVDRAIEAASRAVERLTHRKFYPWTGVRYFDWPNDQRAAPWRLWLEENELLSVTSLVSAGATISPSAYNLEPANDGPPYDRVELLTSGSAAWGGASTAQRSIAITGVFGASDDETLAGVLGEALDDSETAIDISDSAAIGVGDLLRVDDERMLVIGKSLKDTGQTLAADLGGQAKNQTATVADGSVFAAGEALSIGAERLLIEDIADNTLIVKRAWDGSLLESHTTGDGIYAYRTLTVERGYVGTTAATHSDATAIYKNAPPGPVGALCLAEAIVLLDQQSSKYARTIGSGDNQQEARGVGLIDLRKQVNAQYGRIRIGAI